MTTDATNTARPQPEETQSSSPPAAAVSLPDENFACPNCGQMLAPTCRVCVACKQPIDPALIQSAAPVAALPPVESRVARSPLLRVPFPWTLFFVLFAARVAVGGLAERRWGLIKVELALAGFEMLCAIWVFYDATRMAVPRPLRWALGSLLLWPIVFPWYLARRRRPQAVCPFVEGAALPIVILVLVLIGLLYALIKGPIQ